MLGLVLQRLLMDLKMSGSEWCEKSVVPNLELSCHDLDVENDVDVFFPATTKGYNTYIYIF